ncbi:MAG: DUF4338 domain-containing protein [Proteobacteria bacterium]|nr:DUF4338 domain-containing protein [Pseudomonadota bacterium]
MPTARLPRQICGLPFGSKQLAIVHKIITRGQEESIHRTEIARRTCEALNWRNPRGELKQMGARVALLRLHRQEWIELPEARSRNGHGNRDIQQKRLARAPVPESPPEDLVCTLAQLGVIRLQKVENKTDSLLWDGLIERYHYLGHSPLSGAQVRYLIHCEQSLVGAIGFGAAAFKVKARDQWIGWEPEQRERRREWIVNNRRFLILPWIRVRNLASHILAKAARQVQQDFLQQYGYTPVLLETFVEQNRFTGGCYRAANWIAVGQTAGRGRNDRTTCTERKQRGTPLPIKQVWLYPLRKNVRQHLHGEAMA